MGTTSKWAQLRARWSDKRPRRSQEKEREKGTFWAAETKRKNSHRTVLGCLHSSKQAKLDKQRSPADCVPPESGPLHSLATLLRPRGAQRAGPQLALWKAPPTQSAKDDTPARACQCELLH